MALRSFIVAMLAVMGGVSVAAAAEPDLTPVKKWIERQAKIKTLHAKFKQLRHLKTVKKPLESTGEIWFQAPGAIRWQSGDPAKVIATITAGGDLTIQHVEKKKAEVLTRKELEEKSDGMGVAFLESGFPRSLEDFQKRFEVTAVSKVEDYYQVEAKLAEGANPVLRKTVFFIHDGTWTLGGMHFYFRDGSRVESTFSGIEENKAIAASQFTPDLQGYSTK